VKWPLSILILLLNVGYVSGQITDSILLEEVEIKRYKIRDSVGVEIIPASWLEMEGVGGLTNSLQQYSSAFVKNFGPGGMATVSLDGLNPQHTEVFWNGLPVNNSITGVSDLSIYPNSNGMNVRIPEANGMMEFTSGQLGGLLWMESLYTGSTGLSFGATTGSFGRWELMASGRYAPDSSNVELKLDAGYRSLRNDYDFIDYNRDPATTTVLKHAAYQNYFVEPGLLLKAGKYSQLRVDALYSRSLREIPPSVITPNNRADNMEHAMRLSSNWNYQRGKWNNDWMTGYSFDILNYKELNSTDVILASDYRVHHVRLSERLSYDFRDHSLSAGGQMSIYKASGTQLAQSTLASGGFFAGWQANWWKNRLVTNVVIRPEFNSRSNASLSGALDIVYQPSARKPFNLYFTVARNTRFPSISDLYFLPSGNPDLMRETSWKIKGGYKLSFSKKGLDAEHDASAYQTWLKDMILWIPTSKQYWQPVNLRSVSARGLFLKNTLTYNSPDEKWRILAFQAYRLSVSTNEANLSDGNPLFPNDLTIGKQLPYIPEHQLKLNARVGYAGFYLLMNTIYTSERYVTGSNSYALQKYWLMHLGLGYESNYDRFDLNLQFRVKNILDNMYYQEVAHIPMPPRNYELSLRFGYDK